MEASEEKEEVHYFYNLKLPRHYELKKSIKKFLRDWKLNSKMPGYRKVLQIAVLLALKLINCSAGSLNRPPYFVPGTGDFSTFSIPENFQVGTSVYKLKGNP